MKIKFIDSQHVPIGYKLTLENQELEKIKKKTNGREYKLLGIFEKHYSINRRILFGIKAFAKTFFSLGLGLIFFKSTQVEWKSFWTGKKVVAIYTPSYPISEVTSLIAKKEGKVLPIKKSGFPNFSSSCWLAASLQLINTAPQAFAQNVSELRRGIDHEPSESEEAFENRKQIAALILNLLEKSRMGQEITVQEIRNLRDNLHEFSFPNRINNPPLPKTGEGFLCTSEILYILDGFKNSYKFVDEEGNNSYGFQSIIPDDFPHRHLLSAISQKPIIKENHTSLFPFEFTEEAEKAPPIINIPTSGNLLTFNSDDFKFRVRCANQTYCDYELAAVGIYIPGHYYAYVNEKIKNQSIWLKYNDQIVLECLDMLSLEKEFSEKGCEYLYRKCIS